MKYVCGKCGHSEDVTTKKMKCDCGGLWKLDYQPPRFDLSQVDKNTWSLFRYRKFMALTDDTWEKVTLGEGMTPIIPFDEHTLFHAYPIL